MTQDRAAFGPEDYARAAGTIRDLIRSNGRMALTKDSLTDRILSALDLASKAPSGGAAVSGAYDDFGVDADDPESAIAATIDNGEQASRIMRTLRDLGFEIVKRQPLPDRGKPGANGCR